MHAIIVARRLVTALGALAVLGVWCGSATAQERMPDIPVPGGSESQDPSAGEGDPVPVPRLKLDEWDGAGEGPAGEAEPADDRRILQRRRPRLRVVPRGPDIRLEFEFSLQVNSIDGDGHDAKNLDYDDLFSPGSGAGFRVALPLRFHRTASRISLFAGPLFLLDGAGFEGSSFTLPNNDVLIADDMSVLRFGFGGFFRADFGRFYVEPWFSVGGGHVSETDATLDETFNGGGLSTIELYEASSVGHVTGAIRGGISFWPSDAISITIFGEIGFWASGAPDAGAVSVLGDSKPSAMSGVRASFGATISFGLGDFQGGRTAAKRRAAPRRPLAGDF